MRKERIRDFIKLKTRTESKNIFKKIDCNGLSTIDSKFDQNASSSKLANATIATRGIS